MPGHCIILFLIHSEKNNHKQSSRQLKKMKQLWIYSVEAEVDLSYISEDNALPRGDDWQQEQEK